MAKTSKTDPYLADTHALLWHLERAPELGAQARAVFGNTDAGMARVFISAITLVELVYLQDKGRIPSNSLDNVLALLRESDNYVLIAVNLRVVRSLSGIARAYVPDMPDRIIAATALAYNVPLITKDERLRNCAGIRTLW